MYKFNNYTTIERLINRLIEDFEFEARYPKKIINRANKVAKNYELRQHSAGNEKDTSSKKSSL